MHILFLFRLKLTFFIYFNYKCRPWYLGGQKKRFVFVPNDLSASCSAQPLLQTASLGCAKPKRIDSCMVGFLNRQAFLWLQSFFLDCLPKKIFPVPCMAANSEGSKRENDWQDFKPRVIFSLLFFIIGRIFHPPRSANNRPAFQHLWRIMTCRWVVVQQRVESFCLCLAADQWMLRFITAWFL